MSQWVLNDPRYVLQLRVLAYFADDLVLRDSDDLLLHHLVVTLGLCGGKHDLLVHKLVGLISLLQLRQIVLMQCELFFRTAVFIILIFYLGNASHRCAFSRQVEDRITICIELSLIILIFIEIEVFLLFFL